MTRKAILVAGHAGQVARALKEQAAARHQSLFHLGRPSLDLCDAKSVRAAVETVDPCVVINAAAYTAVDAAESDAAAAFAVNDAGAGRLAEETARHGLPILHLSTDYVFDGTKSAPYAEGDSPAPQGVYGHSKLAGERRVAECNPKHLILRTAWVYSPFGKNFAKTMLRLAETRKEIGVVDDQIGNPTSAHDIADALLTLAEMVAGGEAAWGTYHLAAQGETSWAGFAQRIFAASATQGGPVARVIPITTADYPLPAKRPANSRLHTSKLENTFGISLPHWTDSTDACIERIVKEKAWAT